jgi:SAM-dependent methyltransferase
MSSDPGVPKILRRVQAQAVGMGRLLPDPVTRVLVRPARRLAALWQPTQPSPPAAPELVIRLKDVLPLRAIPSDPVPIPVPPLPEGREPLIVWPDTPPSGYLGQLEGENQKRLAQRWAGVTLEDCHFYHRAALPDGRVIEGVWNLIGGEAEYLGGVDLDGRRVLELGPATGWLTVWMEQQGARVVGFDLGWDVAPDLIPLEQFDLDSLRTQHIRFASRVQNAWWFLQHEYGLTAKAVYGSIYDLPADIGRYDVSVFGSILLHLRDPFQALYEAAKRTDEAMVVVEPLRHDARQVDQRVLMWNFTGGANPNGWWGLSPGVVVDMLKVLGFPNATITYHRQPYLPEDNPAEGTTSLVNFTVVARRR